MNMKFPRLELGVALAIGVLSFSASAEDNAERVRSKVIANWSQREAETETLEIVFTFAEAIVDEMMHDGERSPGGESGMEPQLFPTETRRVVLGAQNRARREANEVLFNGVGGGAKSQKMIETRSIDQRRSISPEGNCGRIYPLNEDLFQVSDLAIGILYRGTKETQILTAECSLMDETCICDGVSCTGLSLKAANPMSRVVYWVDLSRDSLPMQYEYRSNDRILAQISIHYNTQGTVSGWDTRHVLGSGIASVTSLVTNAPVDDTEFVIEFPKEYRISDFGNHAILESVGDGSFQPLVGGSARARDRRYHVSFSVTIVLATFFLIGLLMLWRRRVISK